MRHLAVLLALVLTACGGSPFEPEANSSPIQMRISRVAVSIFHGDVITAGQWSAVYYHTVDFDLRIEGAIPNARRVTGVETTVARPDGTVLQQKVRPLDTWLTASGLTLREIIYFDVTEDVVLTVLLTFAPGPEGPATLSVREPLDLHPPGDPVPLGPSGTAVSSRPTLSWQPAPRASRQCVALHSSTQTILGGTCDTTAALCSGGTCAWPVSMALPPGGYFWSVRGTNDYGLLSNWQTLSFTVG